jgi:methionyl-tRNA formyltransferase
VRIVYLGTPAMAVPPLRALHAAGHDIALVVTRADAKRGRGGELSPSPVKAAAVQLGLAVSHTVDDVMHVGAELGVVVAYGRLIKPHVLDAVPMVNVHFSLLPRWRGAAPVERALLAGDSETGVCLMQLEEGLDTGPVHARVTVAIDDATTGDALRAQLVEIGTAMLVEALADPATKLSAPIMQEGEATYAAKLTPDDSLIDWSGDAAAELRKVRLGAAWTTVGGKRLKVHDARIVVHDNHHARLEPVVVQPEGKQAMAYRAWRNGARDAVLGS